MEASDWMWKRGVSGASLPHVIFSFGRAPEYPPYDAGASVIWAKYPQKGVSRFRSWRMHGTAQIAKSPAMPPPI